MAPLEPGPEIDTGPHIIVLGNEKGGSGKSTMAMHIILSLIKEGGRVASIDLDARQKTLSRYLENRAAFAETNDVRLPMPQHSTLPRSDLPVKEEAQAEDRRNFQELLDSCWGEFDFVIIDCPGSDSFLSRLAHTHADTLITPMNDSFVDLDLLARVDPLTHEIEGPSFYAEMVWESRKRRAMRDRGSIDWIVLRNRVASLDARNMRRIRGALGKLARRIGFRFVAGFGERVIYRELFLKGLTLLDIRRADLGEDSIGEFNMSQVAARQELRRLIDDLNLPQLGALQAREQTLRQTG